ncbi:hypothetical protein [uncultured Methylobacterium sp.]|uniref:class I SAM-dependent methyltransferase n=1 Tax=uncultured Methylobacterium sp. TaxID=157278 RepID=UPI00258BB641|nr:hypothetical protein [uncultured Methylobacterium sp.]
MSYVPLLRPSDVFRPPMPVESLDSCFFTHTIDLPGYGTIPGQWDMRGGVEDCIGFVALRGKRILQIGDDSGFLGFEMEKRGAEVIGLDGSAGRSWDIVPFPQPEGPSSRQKLDRHLDTIRRAYWFSHRTLGSRIRLVRGTPYAIPDLIGPADIVVLNDALHRLRDPFRGLHAAARFARETMIVSDVAASRHWLRDLAQLARQPAFFVPRAHRPDGWGSWWRLPPATVQEMLAILGFADSAVHRHRQIYLGAPRLCYTVVARRTGPTSDDQES